MDDEAAEASIRLESLALNLRLAGAWRMALGGGESVETTLADERLIALLNECLVDRDEETIGPALMSAFEDVARRYSGHELTVDPVGRALVKAALEVTFGVRFADSPSQQRMLRTVAQTLLEDEFARRRCQRLWQRFSGMGEGE